MVAQERMKAAEIKEEMLELRRQKDALVSALRVVEGENGVLRAAAAASGVPIPSNTPTSSKPPAAPSTSADTSSVEKSGDSLAELDMKRASRTSSEIGLKSPVPRPPRSPARTLSRSRTPSLSINSRPGTPLISSPLAFTSMRSDSPETPSPTSVSVPTTSVLGGTTLSAEPDSSSLSISAPAAAAMFAPQLAFEGPTPPAGTPSASTPTAGAPGTTNTGVPASAPPPLTRSVSVASSNVASSGGSGAVTPKRPAMPTRRSTFTNPHPDIYDPNHPTSEAEHSPNLAQSPPEPLLQFPRPPIPNLSSLATRVGASLPNIDFESLARAAAASLPGSPIVSPQQSPFFASQPTSPVVGYVGAGGAVARAPSGERGAGLAPSMSRSPSMTGSGASPIAIPGTVRPMPAEESPWADSPILRPALSRMSSVSSMAGERVVMGLGKAKEVLSAGLSSAYDALDLEGESGNQVRVPPVKGQVDGASEGARASERRDSAPVRVSHFEAAAYGMRR
jgi:hypothetical protein